MPCNDCSRTEACPPCPYEEAEACQHPNKVYSGSLYDGPGGRKSFVYYTCLECKAHWKEEVDDTVEPVTEEPEPRCGGCGHTEGEGCGCPPKRYPCPSHPEGHPASEGYTPDDPPLTPEEEEQAPPDEEVCQTCLTKAQCQKCGCCVPEGCSLCEDCPEAPEDCVCGEPEQSGTVHRAAGPCYQEEPPPPLTDDFGQPIRECWECDRVGCKGCPTQPEMRPPYLAAYSVQGHLYEVALPGDATVRAVDGALVITHALGPVAGIAQVMPVPSKESA